MLIDTHAHLNFQAYLKDSDEVIRRSLANDVWMLNVGSQYETSKRAVEIAEKYPQGVWAAIGLHPINIDTGLVKFRVDELEGKRLEKDFDYEKYRDLASCPKVVAIGEIGLDYWYRPKTKIKLGQFKEKQKEIFLEQLRLAREIKLPIIFHCRLGHNDLIEILNQQLESASQQLRGVIHCFTGTWEQAQKYLAMGFYLGFNGLIFKPVPSPSTESGTGGGMNFEEIIKKTPLDKILVETDCPYLTPDLPASAGRSGQTALRNEPIYLKYIAEKVAKIKNISYEEVGEIATENAKRLFKI